MGTCCIVLLLSILLINTVVTLKCYECNLWIRNRGGNNCDKPYVASGCRYCARHYSYVRSGYSQNQKRDINITTLICVKSRLSYSTGCRQMHSSNGYNIRCACDSDLCNTGPVTTAVSVTLATVCLLVARAALM